MRDTNCAIGGLREGLQFFWKSYTFQYYLLRFNLQWLINSQTFTQNQMRSPVNFSTDVRCFDFYLVFFSKRGTTITSNTQKEAQKIFLPTLCECEEFMCIELSFFTSTSS